MTNKTLAVFIPIIFIVLVIVNCFFVYDENVMRSVVASAMTLSIVLLIFIVKRRWDKKQENDFNT